MQKAGWDADRVRAALREARSRDFRFDGGAILGSMCTAPHPIATEAHALFLETNLGDPAHFRGTADLEREVLDDLTTLLHAPRGAAGRFVSGGTEANLLALYAARERTGRRTVVVPDTCHFSFEKAARMLGMHLRTVPTLDHRADPEATRAAIDDDTALVVAVAGTTETGSVDPIPELAAAAEAAGVPLHVDAAFGGYVLPFLADAGGPDLPFDFAVPGVTSISLDPHKMGMSTIPGGVLVLRDGGDWDRLTVDSPYVSTEGQATILGTRPGAAAAACWAVHRRLGRDGFTATVRACMENTALLSDGLAAAGVELVVPPTLNVVAFRHADPLALQARVEAHGFRLNVIPRLNALRIVVNPHVTRETIARFLAALPEAL